MDFRLRSYGITAVTAMVVTLCMSPMRVPAQGRANASAAQAAMKAAAAKPTPRAADGHPDLNGSWDFPGFDQSAHLDANGNLYIDVPPANGGTLPKLDASLDEQLQHAADPNPPPYKPELLAKVKQLADDGVHNDPAFHCKPLGVPRAGAPRQIVQTPKLTVIFYQIDAGDGDQPGSYRLVPTDGRPHRTDVDPSYFGDSVGHWEGDTLVVDVTHFNDDTWLANIPSQGGSGYFHTDALHVVERYTRKGDTLRWEATVEDPNILTKPWVMSPRTEILTQAMIYEQPVCEERETEHIVNKY
jgi:hypothetical protein